MTEKNTVIIVGTEPSPTIQQEKLNHALNNSGYLTKNTTFQELAATIKQACANDILIFNLEGLKEEAGFLKCNKLAETIKNNASTKTIKILCVGISNAICVETRDVFSHSFNDLIFGPIRVLQSFLACKH